VANRAGRGGWGGDNFFAEVPNGGEGAVDAGGQFAKPRPLAVDEGGDSMVPDCIEDTAKSGWKEKELSGVGSAKGRNGNGEAGRGRVARW
jgi:hypothetical protein